MCKIHSMDICMRRLSLLLSSITLVQGSVISPPWVDPAQNPCSSKPNGWQLLYWPKDGQCYRIFQKGFPCPETMELTPGKNGSAECNCPPGTALNSRDAACYKLYKKGPCKENEFFGPVTKQQESSQAHRWGACFEVEDCEAGKVFWPKERKCYKKLTKGPCPEGLLLLESNKFGECACNNHTMSSHYWEPGLSCHEHYSQGPCDLGQIFLPSGKCGCESKLKEYYLRDKKCYAIGTKGPCKDGHVYRAAVKTNGNKEEINGECTCHDGHVIWKGNGKCYQPFTRGPCKVGEMLEVNYTNNEISQACIVLPCTAGRLYFPGGKGCHKVGIQGPCPEGQVVLFQNNKHGINDDISYLGICGCPNNEDNSSSFFPQLKSDANKSSGNCKSQQKLIHNHKNKDIIAREDLCGSGREFVLWKDGLCWQLYTQGPCNDGEWLVPDRGKGQREGRGWREGKCECRPGYTTSVAANNTICLFNLNT